MLKLYFVAENSYFDQTEFTVNPIKKFLSPYYLTSYNNTSQYYYMLLSKNDVSISSSLIYKQYEQTSFVETRMNYKIAQELAATDAYNNAYIAIYIQMDDEVKKVQRTHSTLLDVMQNTGGFMSVIVVIAFVMIQYF